MIQKWKNNRIPNYMLTDDEFKELAGFGYENLEWYSKTTRWEKNNSPIHRSNSLPHRLRPDYEPEPEIEKCRIYILEGELRFDRATDNRIYALDLAVRFASFSHFETDKGAKIQHLEDIAAYIHDGGKVYACFRKD